MIKIQSVVRGFQDRTKAKKERASQALERYKNLIPQSTIANMMKPNETFLGNEQYIWNQIKEENKKEPLEKMFLCFLYITKHVMNYFLI